MRAHVRTIVVFAGLAIAARGFGPLPAPPSSEGLAAMLGRAAMGTVRPTDIAWEPSPGVLTEILTGRRVLYLASQGGGARDLYRASVRLTLEGRPVCVGNVRDLTSTPLGDEQDLIAKGDRAAFATSSYGKVESVTLLDTRGRPEVSGATWLDKLTGSITNRQETGSSEGLGRIDVVLDVPQPRVALAFDPSGRLVIGAADGRACRLDPDTVAMTGPLAAHATAEPALQKKPILWAVDTVRAEIGPEAISWLEEKVYGARDYVRRGRYAWFGAGDEPLQSASPARIVEPRALDASGVRADPSGWPPPSIVSIWKNADAQEGQWEPVTFAWLKRLGRDAPPYYLKTTIRPDAERPYVKVVLIAMDMRQLDLDMEGGVEDPKSLTGVHGAGKIPRDPGVINRVVGAFNGAFKTTHGEYGMMVSGKVLLPPRPNAATLVVTKDRRIGLGTWGATGAIPDDLASLRQNLDPLVEDGKLMPSGRTQWGFQLAGTSLFTMRSGICTSAGGHLYYLWGEELSGQTLARAMLQAGCTYGMHLDMNLHHTAFVFASVRNIATKDYDAKILTPVMEVMPERYLEWAPKDFFYLMLRDPRPPFDEVDLAPDGGTQPAPAFIGAVWKGAVSRAVELTVFDPERIGWRLRVAAPREGGKPDKDFVTEPLPDEEAARVLCAVGVGNPGKGALLRASAVVTVDAGSHLVFTEPEQAGATENVALPYVLLGGKPTPAALDRQPVRRRASLCIADNGHVVLASSVAECEQSNAEALAKMGCSRAVALDLGAHLPWSIDRAGTAEPPLTHYGQSVLYALGQPMPPKTFRYGAVGK